MRERVRERGGNCQDKTWVTLRGLVFLSLSYIQYNHFISIVAVEAVDPVGQAPFVRRWGRR